MPDSPLKFVEIRHCAVFRAEILQKSPSDFIQKRIPHPLYEWYDKLEFELELELGLGFQQLAG